MGNQYSALPTKAPRQRVPGKFNDDKLDYHEKVMVIHHDVPSEMSSDLFITLNFPTNLSNPHGASVIHGPIYNSSEQVIGYRKIEKKSCHYCYDLLPKCGKFIKMGNKDCDISFSKFTKDNPLELWKLVDKELIVMIPARYDYIQFIARNVATIWENEE